MFEQERKGSPGKDTIRFLPRKKGGALSKREKKGRKGCRGKNIGVFQLEKIACFQERRTGKGVLHESEPGVRGFNEGIGRCCYIVTPGGRSGREVVFTRALYPHVHSNQRLLTEFPPSVAADLL